MWFVWPWNLIILVIRDNLLHNYHLNGRPQKIWAKKMSDSWITENPWTQKSIKWEVYLLRDSFNLQNESLWLLGQLAPYLTSLWMSTKIYANNIGFWITKKIRDYTTQKLAKWGFYLLWGSFDLQYGPFWLSGPTGSIDNVLMCVDKKFGQKTMFEFWITKYIWTIVH